MKDRPLHTIIIAEAGVNHNGSIILAKRLIDAAAHAGADVVKFQTFNAKRQTTEYAPKARYQINGRFSGESQQDMLRKLELSYEDHYELIEYCKYKKITFLSSPFDIESLNFLLKLNIGMIKIPSGELTNLPFLRQVGISDKPILMSTGMSTMDEVEWALKILCDCGAQKSGITILHCNTEYPTPMQDVNLKAMKVIGEKLGIKIGYSDHTLGIEVPIAAVAMGASVIEKHLTLDRSMDGPDHMASMEPSEFLIMCKSIRNIEQALGDGVKQPSPSELNNRAIARKSIVAKTHINIGDFFSEENLDIKRPGDGMSPILWDSVIGKCARFEFMPDDFIKL